MYIVRCALRRAALATPLKDEEGFVEGRNVGACWPPVLAQRVVSEGGRRGSWLVSVLAAAPR